MILSRFDRTIPDVDLSRLEHQDAVQAVEKVASSFLGNIYSQDELYHSTLYLRTLQEILLDPRLRGHVLVTGHETQEKSREAVSTIIDHLRAMHELVVDATLQGSLKGDVPPSSRRMAEMQL